MYILLFKYTVYVIIKKRYEKKYICSFVSIQEFHKVCEKDPMLQKYGSKKIRLSSANTHSYDKSKFTKYSCSVCKWYTL